LEAWACATYIPPEKPSFANLIPFVDNFQVQTAVFSSTTPDVQDGYIQPGKHRILRFDFLVLNAGHLDLILGSPAERPELFIWSLAHDHYHIKEFNGYQLIDRYGMR